MPPIRPRSCFTQLRLHPRRSESELQLLVARPARPVLVPPLLLSNLSHRHHISTTCPLALHRSCLPRSSQLASRRISSTSSLRSNPNDSNGNGLGPEPPEYLSDSERAIFEKLRSEFQPSMLEVQDISGGCGSMYALDITSPRFQGLSVIKQHKLVNQVLAEEIKSWHGVQLKTRAG